MFPFMAGIFYFPLPPIATHLESLQKGEAVGLHQEKPAVYIHTLDLNPLSQKQATQDAPGIP